MRVIILAKRDLFDHAYGSSAYGPLTKCTLAVMVARAWLTLTMFDPAHFAKSINAWPGVAHIIRHMYAVRIPITALR